MPPSPEIAAVPNKSRFSVSRNLALYHQMPICVLEPNFNYILYELFTLYGAGMVNWRYLRETNGAPTSAPLTAVTLRLRNPRADTLSRSGLKYY